jgi:PKD repeat protein/dienelactone hydrolase
LDVLILRTYLLILILFASLLALVTVVALADDTMAEAGPMVQPPDGRGPMFVGHMDTTTRFSTKDYDTHLRIFYPAANEGIGTPPDISGAPYMTVVWFPFFGGNHEMLDQQSQHLASWGAVVVAYGVNWEDMENSGNPDDMNDLLDMLEDLNTTNGHTLFGMVDKEAYGVCGYSSGGGASLITGAQVPRIKAIQSHAAAIYNAAVDGIAPMFNGRPLLLQVGKDDAPYIDGSRRAYQKVGAPCILVEIIGAGHGGPFMDHMYVAFYLYHLQGNDDYRTFLYGDEAVNLVADGRADVYFKLDDDHFFPPVVTTKVSPLDALMDEPVSFNVTIRGYQRENITDLVHGWDLTGSGRIDLRLNDEYNATHAFPFPAHHQVQYLYTIRQFNTSGEVHSVTVTNAPPVAVAGPDVVVDHDGSATLDGGGSWDTPSDVSRLQYRWEFSDGFIPPTGPGHTVSRQFNEVGVLTDTLTVSDPHGALMTDTLNITVVNVPPSLTVDDGLTLLEDDPMTLEGIGTDTLSHAGHLVYRWDYGDGMTSEWRAISSSNHSYPMSRNYTATLSVKDPEGAVASSSTNVTVLNLVPEGIIVLPLNSSEHDKGELVGFAANGSDTPSDEVFLVFMWDFGDGEATDWLGHRDTQVSHRYVLAGTFQVVLTVMDTDGAFSSVSHTISVLNTPPEATILRPGPSAEVQEDTQVKFAGTGTDTPDDQDGLTYEWLIDGVTYSGDKAEHTFTGSGTYSCKFSVTDPGGATVSVTVEVTVANMAPEATLELDLTTVEVNGSVAFMVLLYDTPSDIEDLLISWDFGDESTSSEIFGTHSYTSAGTYLVRVTVEDDDGEVATSSITVTVTDPPKPPVDPNDDGPSGDTSDDPLWPYVLAGIIVAVAVIGVLVMFVMPRKGGAS